MRTLTSSVEPLEARIAPSVFTVTSVADSGTGSLRDALLQADNHLGPDTILFHVPAPLAHSESIISLTSGELTSKGDVTLKGPGAGKLIIDGGGTDRVLLINDTNLGTDSPVTISGLSIVHGKASGNGGGIYSFESLTLKKVIISGNSTSASGGGLSMNQLGAGTKVKITHSLISGNQADGFSGGLDFFDLKSITLTKTVVTGNTATQASGGISAHVDATAGTGIKINACVIAGNTAASGGGLTVQDPNTAPASKITISGTTITGNTSTTTDISQFGGGGLLFIAGNAVITGSVIGNNTAAYYGGGLEAKGFASLTISGSIISGNATTKGNLSKSDGGGGISVNGSSPAPVKITGSRVIDNRSAFLGGGLLTKGDSALTIFNSTFSGNRADNFGAGGGVYSSGGNLTVSGGEFSDNTAESFGGGIAAVLDTLSIAASKVTGNTAVGGGGIYLTRVSSATIKNVVVTGNFVSSDGAGIEVFQTPDFKISGGAITGNVAGRAGGGIEAYLSTGSILGVTISGNTAMVKGGGVFQKDTGTVTLQVAKVVTNTAPTEPDVSGTFTFG